MSKHPKHLAALNAVADRAGWASPRRRVSIAAWPR